METTPLFSFYFFFSLFFFSLYRYSWLVGNVTPSSSDLSEEETWKLEQLRFENHPAFEIGKSRYNHEYLTSSSAGKWNLGKN
jgi:hypothetical protein